MFFDPMQFIFLLPAMILAGIAAAKTKGTFNKYSRVMSASQITGAQAARKMLNRSGIYDVEINRVKGYLSDHYNPINRTLNLSPKVYDSQSLAAIGVACHEAGHALQHAAGYAPLKLRSAMVPAVQFSSHAAIFFLIIGFLMNPMIAKFGIILLTAGVLFSLITLPVEWDASARAKRQMVTDGIVRSSEAEDAGKVLDAAFLTYVAAAVSAILTLLYWIMRLGLLGGRND